MAYENVELDEFFNQLTRVANELQRNQEMIREAMGEIHPRHGAPGAQAERVIAELLEVGSTGKGYFEGIPINIEFGKGAFGNHIKLKKKS